MFAYFAGFSMYDDGMRHIAFAAHPDIMKSWGDVFPNSLFVKDYDPWYLWDQLLAFLIPFVGFEYIHIFINTFIAFALFILVDIYLSRYVKYNLSSLVIIITLGIVAMSTWRYFNMRPDALSGIFVLASLLLRNSFISNLILTAIYGPFYYVFWIYTGSIGLVRLYQGYYKAFFGLVAGSLVALAIHFYFGGINYWNVTLYVFQDQSLRQGLSVGESMPIFSFLKELNYIYLSPLFFGITVFLLYKFPTYFKTNTLAIFLLLTSILWINQYRFYYNFYPILLVFLFITLMNMNKKHFFYSILYYLARFKHFMLLAQNKKIFFFAVIPYTALMFALSIQNTENNNRLKETNYYSKKIFNNKIILSNDITTDLNFALYNNPSIKFIPSCGIGWFNTSNKEIKDIYIRMRKEEGISIKELEKLLKYVKPDFYMHRLNHKNTINFSLFKTVGLEPLQIIDHAILFKYISKK